MFQIQDYDDLFLYVYCFVDDALKDMAQQMGYRFKTRSELKAAETLTIQIVGEFMEKKTETAIYMLLKEYDHLFSAVIPRSSFYKQLKKYFWLLDYLMAYLSEKFDNEENVCFPDGFPIPIKKFVRRNKGVDIGGRAAVGYCASLDEYFYGLKGHILVGANGIPRRLLFSPGNVHDIKLLEPLLMYEHDQTIGCDKGYISHEEAERAAINNNKIITQKRKNQIGHIEHNEAIRPLMKQRKIVETIISHLERMYSKVMKQRCFWMIITRMQAKCMAIGGAIAYNIEHNLERPLRMKSLHPEFL